MDLATVIVNYRSAGMAAECLRSLSAEPHGAVVVVDNASDDDSMEHLRIVAERGEWTEWCHVVGLDSNLGYAAGNNAGVRYVEKNVGHPEFYLFLNPDTIVRPGAIAKLMDFMKNHPHIGIAGSRLEDLDETPQRSAFRFPCILGELESGLRLGLISKFLSRQLIAPPVRHDHHPSDWVAGASMMVRRDMMEDIGLMDESYFLYFEELDYCRKSRRAGWATWYVPESRVVHFVGQSTGVTNTKSAPRRMPAYWFASRKRYFRKNHGVCYSLLADAAWTAGYAVWRVRRWLQGKPDTDPPNMLRDFIGYNFFGILRSTT